MNKNIQDLVKQAGLYTPDVNQQIVDEFARLLLLDCAGLLLLHAKELADHNFSDKSKTAMTCAGIILEHYGFKGNKNDSSN